MSDQEKSHEFQAEISQLLQLMVHSVYSEREIFVRELISNAADALDKLRYEAIAHPELISDDSELKITLGTDKDARTITVADNGTGMNEQDLIDNLGTIARSGTKAFLESIKAEDGAPNLIGQFGIGFYSAFIVASQVDVLTRKAGDDESWLWSSDGSGGFSIAPADSKDEDRFAHGTKITLHLKEDADEFLEAGAIERIVRTYSDHISFPIEIEEEKDGEKSMRQLNEGGALWSRSKSDISDDQYKEFYHHAGGMFDEPALTIHYRAEGRHSFIALLFVPTSRPFDLFDASRKDSVKLYVRRVFITDSASLLPSYLRFVRGVVDSEDMPLNLSREMLQNNPMVEAISKAVTNKVLKEMASLAKKDSEKYDELWKVFGAVIKEGLYEDAGRRDALYELTRFSTTTHDGLRSLKDYVSDMKENQTAIYYIIGETNDRLAASPLLEGYKARGLEVLLLTDPVDNFWVTTALGFDGKPFQSVTQGEASLDTIAPENEEDKADEPEASADSIALIDRLKKTLEGEVDDVRSSQRLVDSPACLIAPQGAPDRALEKIMAAQHGGADNGLRPVLEINSRHKLLKALEGKTGPDETQEFEDLAWLLLDEARILEGGSPADPAKFTERLNRLLVGKI